jgi:hypothetical protein
MSMIGDATLSLANSKIRRNHTIGPGNLTGWQPPPPAKSEEEHRESEDAWARFKEALAAAILAADEDAIRDADFPNWCDYWGAALAWDMPVTDFVFLIETHALTPERTAMEIKSTAVPFATFLMKGLDEALQSRESWIYGETKAEKCRVRPREAAMWLNRRLSGQARLPDTLRDIWTPRRIFPQRLRERRLLPRVEKGKRHKSLMWCALCWNSTPRGSQRRIAE